jgi:translation initiation factor 2B subunit (eIF-2B alpha/beta/delta family)
MDDLAFETALNELRTDRVQGASELARRCLVLLARSAQSVPASKSSELLDVLACRCDRLKTARPSMAPIQNLLTAWKSSLARLDGLSLPVLRSAAADRARDGIRQSKQAMVTTVENAAEFIGSGKTVITHSLSSTVLGVFERLKNRNIRAIATESRPLNEGNILARQLSERCISTQLITDAQLGLFVAKADLALLGADSLLPDGSLVNKSGSYLLALAAHDCGVPLYVCCESFKRRKEGIGQLELEEMDARELGAPSLPGVRVRNIYFDITPAGLIDRWIDETGVHATGILSEGTHRIASQ